MKSARLIMIVTRMTSKAMNVYILLLKTTQSWPHAPGILWKKNVIGILTVLLGSIAAEIKTIQQMGLKRQQVNVRSCNKLENIVTKISHVLIGHYAIMKFAHLDSLSLLHKRLRALKIVNCAWLTTLRSFQKMNGIVCQGPTLQSLQ